MSSATPVPKAFATATYLKVDSADAFNNLGITLMREGDVPGKMDRLGEAIYCRQEDDAFYVGVELEHALHGLVALGDMLRGFSEDRSSPEHAYAMQNADGEDQ